MTTSNVIVIGGGPAGIMAAGRAAEKGARVVLLEKGPQLGRKLRICGKGRGNITNTAELNEFIEAFAPNGKFLYGAFSRFFRDDLLKLLQGLGIETKVERGGRVFPVSDSAQDVTDALNAWMISCGVGVRMNSRARSIEVEEGRVVGVKLYGGRMSADAVVIATGGASYPKTGSTGDGYVLAQEVGHTIIAPEPALSAMVAREKWVKDLQGLSLKNVRATLFPASETSSKGVASEMGEMLFTHFGLSGPIILSLSRKAKSYLKQGDVIVSIDLKPALSEEQLHARFIREFVGAKQFKNYLPELLPRLLVDTFLDLSAIDYEKPMHSITAVERGRLIGLLKDLRVTIKSLSALEEAIVTSGGVAIKEIDPRTMMSKLVSGLFFAGEVMDIDGETGGFNLQAAFSTGFVAGEAASEMGREPDGA